MEEVNITPEQQKAYLKAPNTCPFCGSTNIESRVSPEVADTQCWQDIQCNDCDMCWTDVYKLSHIENAYKNE